MALWVMVLSRFSAPLITLAPTPPPSCLFIPMTYSFKCNAYNFDKVRCKLQRIESEHKAGSERQRFWKWHSSGATMKGVQMPLAWHFWETADCIFLNFYHWSQSVHIFHITYMVFFLGIHNIVSFSLLYIFVVHVCVVHPDTSLAFPVCLYLSLVFLTIIIPSSSATTKRQIPFSSWHIFKLRKT